MARNTQDGPLQIALGAAGMDQSHGRNSPLGTFDLLKNCRFRSGGLQKRCGSTAITGTTYSSSTSLSVVDSSEDPRPTEHPAFIARIGAQKVCGTSAGIAFGRTSTWLVQGGFSAAQPVRKRAGIPPSLPSRVLGPYMPGCSVTSDGYICTAAGFGPELRITVESPTGEVAFEKAEVIGAAGVIVRVVVVGSVFYVLAQGSASTSVTYRRLTVSGGFVAESATGTLVTLNNASSTWDASSYDGTTWFAVYQSGATTVTVAEFTGVTAGSTATFSTTDNLTYLSVWADPVTDRVWVGVVDDPAGTPAPAYRVYTDAVVLETGPTSLAPAIAGGPPLFGPIYTRSPAAGDAFCVRGMDAGDLGTGSTPIRLVTNRIIGGSVATTQTAAFNLIPISKPDMQQRVWVMTHGVGSNFQTAQVALVRFADADQAGAAGGPTPIVELCSPPFETPGSTYHPKAQPGRAFHAVAVTSEAARGSAFFASPFVLTSRTNASGNTEPTTRVDVYEYTRYNQEPHRQIVSTGKSAIVAGQPTELWGLISQIAGIPFVSGAVEIGWLHGPTIISHTATPAGNGLAAGTYVYYAIQQWVDDEGNRHLSAPSAPYTVTLTVPCSVALNIGGMYAGQRPSSGRDIAVASPPMLLFRTQNGGTEAQQVPISTAEPGPTWAGYVTATDTVADSIIDDNEFLYTAGGVLPNVLAPSCRYIAASEDRLWCGGLWASDVIECSKVRVPGEPYNFTGDASHQVVIPGEVTGLAYMDGQVVVFCEDAIYVVSGDGPNDQGAGGFAPPRALVRGVGCPREQSASILETEIGIIFRSTMSFYLIPRGLGTPQEIGDKVRDEDEFVLSAATTTTANYRLARFLVTTTGGTKSSKVLTLDLTNGQWVRDEYNVDGSSITGQGFSEIGEWPDGLALFSYGLSRDDNLSVVWAESESETSDAGAAGAGASSNITQSARTTWWHAWGPVGYGRLTRVLVSAEAIGASSTLTLTVETDANATQSPFWGVTTSEVVSYRAASIAQPLCTAFRLTLEDSGSGAGMRLVGLACEIQPLQGLRAVIDSEAA